MGFYLLLEREGIFGYFFLSLANVIEVESLPNSSIVFYKTEQTIEIKLCSAYYC